jgi:hypothetical protein
MRNNKKQERKKKEIEEQKIPYPVKNGNGKEANQISGKGKGH